MEENNRIGFSGPELCRKQAHEVVSLLRAGEISPRELLDAAYSRIEAVGHEINATVHVCRERAYSSLDKLTETNKDHPGWLGGLPIGIKDLTPIKGVKTTFGTIGLSEFVPDESDSLVDRLEALGAIVTGKTNTPEMGAGGVTFNDVYGPTLNPWNTKLNPGGSSGGAAASLAAGETWLSHGSDHGGSLRTPAAYCGIVGLRPSPGVAGGSSKESAFTIEGVQGPMARSVTDCALFLDAMAGFDPNYPISYPAPETSYQEAVRRAEGNIRLAFSPNLNNLCPVEPEVRDHLRESMEKIAGNGAAVEEVQPELADLERTYLTLRAIMWACNAWNLPEDVKRHFKQTLKDTTSHWENLTSKDIIESEMNRSKLYYAMLDLLTRFDALACPVVGCMPREISKEWVDEINGEHLTTYMDWLRFAFLATVTSLPAISVPVGLSKSGMPVGLQLIGPPRGEAKLLACARAVEVAVNSPLVPIDPQTK